ncbi:MAG: carboxynorspermidine decarboxylase [Lachnospiraceae bacterium]|nr:carboxynorspermidine decarboxylase [Lachnospiraceae bacterium]
MAAKETRPAFRGLEGKTPQELFQALPTPCYMIDEKKLRENGKVLASVSRNTGCKILLAQKAFSNYDCYPVLSEYLAGTEASGLYEARLGAEEMPEKEVHVFCGAYREDEFDELLQYADHIVFNSPRQLKKFGKKAKREGKSLGLRINPECSTQDGHAIYDPCAPGSRLGTTRAVWDKEMTEELVSLLDGLHFHTLCEQDAGDLETTLRAVEETFGDILPKMKWLNMGGGHHITKPGYNISKLEQCIWYAKKTWKVDVYLEPGEAVALNAGYFASRVLDIVQNGETKIAILDASAACHMPDVIEMPYTPPLYGARETVCCAGVVQESEAPDGEVSVSGNDALPGSNCGQNVQYRYRLAGPTCLAGDVIGDYSFEQELNEGDLLLFGDMAIYTTCKNNTFNGMPLPQIWKRTAEGEMVRLTEFGYEEFKRRLGGRKEEEN